MESPVSRANLVPQGIFSLASQKLRRMVNQPLKALRGRRSMNKQSVESVNELKIEDLDFQTMPAGTTSVIHPGVLGFLVFVIIFS
jgi:hypothetical protein